METTENPVDPPVAETTTDATDTTEKSESTETEKSSVEAPPKTEKPEPPKPKCAICKLTRGIRMCTGCHLVGYCSVGHQKEDWPTHKQFCLPPFKIQVDSSQFTGKICVTTKDVNRGQLILNEPPILHYKTKPANDYWPCVTCGRDIEEGTDPKHRCKICNWPVCSDECREAGIHAKNECKIFAHNNISYTEQENLVTAARAFSFRSQNPARWKDILQLVPLASAQEFKDQEIRAQILNAGNTSNLKSSFPEFSKEDNPAKDEIEALSLAARFAGFTWTMNKELKPEMGHTFLYQKAGHFHHSCAANCIWDIGPAPDFKIRIRAAHPIKKGETLTINRLGHLYFDTLHRQEIYRERFKKNCACALCSNSRELGTFQCGICCTNCKEIRSRKEGFLLPVDPLNQNDLTAEKTIWECSVCGHTESGSTFWDHLLKIYEPFKEVEKTNLKQGFIRWEVLKLLKESKGSFLHPNHWIVQQAFVNFFQFCEYPQWKLGEFWEVKPEVELRLERLSHLLAILDTTCPGIQHERVRLKQMWGDTQLNLMDDACKKENFEGVTQEDAFELERKLVLTVNYYREALIYWQGLEVPKGQEKLKEVEVLTDKIVAARKLMEHVQVRIVQFRKDEDELKDENIEDWGFRYKKPIPNSEPMEPAELESDVGHDS